MKKKLLIILIILLYLSYYKTNSSLVFNTIENEYAMYLLEFPNQNISTNNIEKIFKDIQIIWIEPNINKIYKDKFNYKIYYFENKNIKNNLNKFKHNFIEKLDENNYKIDAINYKITGIKIDKMKVYAKEEDILKLQIEGIKYKKLE